MIEQSIEILKSDEELFDLTQDYSRRLAWDPFPESYQFLNGRKIDTGLQLVVKDKRRRAMTVEYVSFKPPKVAAIKMVSGPWYIKKFAGSWSFKSLESNKTKVVFKYHIVGYPFFLGVAVRQVFKCNTKKRLKALKAYAEKHLTLGNSIL